MISLMTLAFVQQLLTDPVEVSVVEAFAKPHLIIGKNVRLCGLTGKGFNEALYVYEISSISGSKAGVDVNAAVESFRKRGGVICYTGIFRRRDGQTASQLSASGEIYATVSHAIVNTAYFLADR